MSADLRKRSRKFAKRGRMDARQDGLDVKLVCFEKNARQVQQPENVGG